MSITEFSTLRRTVTQHAMAQSKLNRRKINKRKRYVKLCRVRNFVRRRIFPNTLRSLMAISECYYLARSFLIHFRSGRKMKLVLLFNGCRLPNQRDV